MSQIFETHSPEETEDVGRRLSETVSPGDVICLNGDLGAGKTVFVKGLAKGLGVTDPVVSPTFTIVQEYRDGRLPLYHFDVYRIEDPEEMEEVGLDDYFYGDGVSVVEWAGLIAELIPDSALRVQIDRVPGPDTESRRITVYGGQELADSRD